MRRHAGLHAVERRGTAAEDLRGGRHRRRLGGEPVEESCVLHVLPAGKAQGLAQFEHDHVAESIGRLQADRAEPATSNHEHVGQLTGLERQPQRRAEIEHQPAETIGGARRLRQADAIDVAGLARGRCAGRTGNRARLQKGGVGRSEIGQRNEADAVVHGDGAGRREDAVDAGRLDLGHDERLSPCRGQGEQERGRRPDADAQHAHLALLIRAPVHSRPHCCYRQAPGARNAVWRPRTGFGRSWTLRSQTSSRIGMTST